MYIGPINHKLFQLFHVTLLRCRANTPATVKWKVLFTIYKTCHHLVLFSCCFILLGGSAITLGLAVRFTSFRLASVITLISVFSNTASRNASNSGNLGGRGKHGMIHVVCNVHGLRALIYTYLFSCILLPALSSL